jgi:site-specific DNA-methyltransferase (adenine-specific)/modification methylase
MVPLWAVSGSRCVIFTQFNLLDLQHLSSYNGEKEILKMKRKIFQPNDYINKVFEEDCLDLMAYFPDACIDMVLCDLPYGTTQNKWDSVIPLDKLWEQYNRIIKKNGAIVLTSQGIFTAKLILSNEKDFKYKIVWEKSKPTNFLNAKKQPLRKHEDICVFYRNQPTYNPQMSIGKSYSKGIRKDQYTGSYGDFRPVLVESKDGLRYPNDIVYFKTPESEMDGTVWHPTQKPVELGRYLIRTYSNPGDIVLDNTCGAGSFLVSALLEQRNFIGIEKNQDARLFKEDTIDLIGITKQRLSAAFYSDDKIAFSKNLAREGVIKEFVGNGRIKISV